MPRLFQRKPVPSYAPILVPAKPKPEFPVAHILGAITILVLFATI